MRKLVIGLVAATALLAPTVAFAGGKHGGGKHGGGHHHHGHHHHFRHHGGVYFAGGDYCWRYRTIETRHGLVRRLVNVCSY